MADAAVKMHNHTERCEPLKAALNAEQPSVVSSATSRTQTRCSNSIPAPQCHATPPISSSCPHANRASRDLFSLDKIVAPQESVTVDGASLTIPEVVAVSLCGMPSKLTEQPEVLALVEESVSFLEDEISKCRTIYGVTTGFGGSADTRTEKAELLQSAAVQHLNAGILLPADKGIAALAHPSHLLLRSHALPTPIVRAMMLIRCNSLLRGHSGVRSTIIDAILKLLSMNMTPVVPLRGSISASGDLSTLSYIAGALEGNPDIFIRSGLDNTSSEGIYLPADVALQQAGLQPVRLQAKEALGITNGTAASCAAACIAVHQAHQLALLSQALTAMATEALLGTAHNYDPFISSVRPHRGQAEVAANIRAFLSGSVLSPDKGISTTGLAQDRYSLRTAPQWIGPQLEDLQLAYDQVSVELNSTTDNPLLDVTSGRIHHGGNFQAASITSAAEKTSMALQNIGRLLLAQSSELCDHSRNKGLPPSLCADDPSTSFTAKGFDVNMAAYMAELARLAHPVGAHMVPAEMGNQSVNSLALIAARGALDAVEVLSLMTAAELWMLCQALDLRCMHLEFVKMAEPAVVSIVRDVFGPIFRDDTSQGVVAAAAWKSLVEKWAGLSHLDLEERGPAAAKESTGRLMEALMTHTKSTDHHVDKLGLLNEFQSIAGTKLSELYGQCRAAFFKAQTTPKYLGRGSRAVYEFVRNDLNVPMHRGLVDHPTLAARNKPSGINGTTESTVKLTLGTMASDIYLAIRDGRLPARVIEAWRTLQTTY